MQNYTFEQVDNILLSQNGRIIHQIWFGNIPNKREAKKAFAKLAKHRDTWLDKNPDWFYICWNLELAENFVRKCYPQHWDLYRNYSYQIQRCDVLRYFFLHRYGGLYADMDYHCNRSWNEVVRDYPNDFYLVETPNSFGETAHVSNSLMYCRPRHIFWHKLFIDLENNATVPSYYSRHIAIMFTTGPGILNRCFKRYRLRYGLSYYPSQLFHPYGLSKDKLRLENRNEVYAYHLGKGSWEKSDSKFLIFLYTEWRILVFLLCVLILPLLISQRLIRNRS